jgi:hypothetical protein
MILISLDSSIVIANFGVALFDTSIHSDPYRCFLPIEQPEAFRKRVKIPLPVSPGKRLCKTGKRKGQMVDIPLDETGLERAKILAKWIGHIMFGLTEYGDGVVVLTESNTGKASWANDPKIKAGRSKMMDLNRRANDWVLSIVDAYDGEIIEVNPADKQMFPTPKDKRVNRIDNLAGISWRNGLTVAQCGHVADAFYRAAEWANWQKIRIDR